MLQARERVMGPEHPDTILTNANLATSLHQQAKHPEAEVLLRQVPNRGFNPERIAQ